MRLSMLAFGAMGFFTLVACEDQPCDRYVDYVCACHADDPELDCGELQVVLADADPEIQDTCAVDLADLEEADAADGLACSVP